jgi:hypothetical protein
MTFDGPTGRFIPRAIAMVISMMSHPVSAITASPWI